MALNTSSQSVAIVEDGVGNHLIPGNEKLKKGNSSPRRPPVPEKPLVPAKPKPKPASPPKPASLISPSSLKSSRPTKKSSPHSVENITDVSCNLTNGIRDDNGTSEDSKNSASTPEPKSSHRPNLAKLDFSKSDKAKSKEPPPLPLSPPPTQRKPLLMPSTSLSLPSSFRHKGLSTELKDLSPKPQTDSHLLSTPSLSPSKSKPVPPTGTALQVSSTSPTPLIKKTPPQTHPKPKSRISLTGKVVPLPDRSENEATDKPAQNDTHDLNEQNESANSDISQATHSNTSSDISSDTQINHSNCPSSPTSQSELSAEPVRKPPERPLSPPTPSLGRSISPPNRPTSPPNKSTSPLLNKTSPSKQPKQAPQRPTSPPSKPTMPVPNADSCSSQQDQLSVKDPELKTEKKIPPPLPQNPPRGGIVKRRRSGKTPHNKEITTTKVGVSEPAGSDPPQEDPGDNQQKPEKEQIDLSSVVDQRRDSKTPPKPRPRTRLSLTSPQDSEFSSQLEAVSNGSQDAQVEHDLGEVDSRDTKSFDKNLNSLDSKPQDSTSLVPELDYVEVYRGDSDGDEDDGKIRIKIKKDNKNPEEQGKDSLNNQSLSKRVQEIKASDTNTKTDTAESKIEAETFCDNEWLSNDEKEPESTCGMLKEIEDLLKSKLGSFEQITDLEHCERDNSETKKDIENHDTPRRKSRKKSISKSETGSSPSSSPVRPPRPKRQASMSRLQGSQESLASSTEGSGPEPSSNVSTPSSGNVRSAVKKFVPPKPKRTSIPKVNRSHSDVTGMKSLVDKDEEDFLSLTKSEQEEVKPFLPPRLESLRKSESANQIPPPLPPRNQPANSSSQETGKRGFSSSSSSASISTQSPSLATNLMESTVKTKGDRQKSPANASKDSKGQSSGSPVSTLTRNAGKPRPTRKAPPPPPNRPQRAATFTPGSEKQSENEKSPNQPDSDLCESESMASKPSSPTVKKSYSMSCKSPTSSVSEDLYHEIAECLAAGNVAPSQKKDDTPMPQLPPRTFRSNSVESDQNSAESIEVRRGSSGNPEDQKQREKKAKTALIQKVAQGLGLGKSSKKSKSFDSSPSIPSETESQPAGDSVIANSAADSIDMEETIKSDDTSQEKTEPTNIEISLTTVENTKEGSPPVEASSSKGSSLERPASMISTQSTCSEQDTETGLFGSQIIEEAPSSESESDVEEEDKEEIYAKRKEMKVFFIAREIMTSESTFVDVLKLLNVDFRVHMSTATEKLGQPILPSETLNKILDFLPQLQNFNENLLKDLTERVEHWEKHRKLADIFVKKGPFLKLYSTYIRNFENATSVLDEATKKNPAFVTALKEFEMGPRCEKLALKHYMLKPIQRIPQYKLLLQDYLKHLTPESPDYKDTITALNIVSEVADHANESMRQGDNVQKLMEIQRSLIGHFEVIQPGRELVKQGELQKLSRKEMQPRMFILFNDVLLYTTPATTGYKINNILTLTGMKVIAPKVDDSRFEFNIISTQRSFTLCASSSKEKEEWMSALQSAIELNTQKHHTFEAQKQGHQLYSQLSLMDKDFVLGHKAPLWVPDSRVTMCMLCLVEFTITWRRHHCRSCGRIICSHCSDNKAPLRYLKYKPARVCDECYEKLKEELTNEIQPGSGKKRSSTVSISEEDSSSSLADGATDLPDGKAGEAGRGSGQDSGLSLNSLLARFQKIRISNREKRKPTSHMPSVLKEVQANDEGSVISGYLRIYKSRKWKRLWFVLKGEVLYTYRACEDVAAIESLPLLGYEVAEFRSAFEGADPEHLFELTHQNKQPLNPKRTSDRTSGISPADKTTQRFIYRTENAESTAKWVTVLRKAALAYQ